MRADLRALLAAAPGVPAVYWSERPQGSALPAVVLSRISEFRLRSLDGVARLAETRVQADVWAETTMGAGAVADAVSAALSGFMGVRGGTRFHAIFPDGVRDDLDPDDLGALYRVVLDFLVHHSDA
jgi:hypothetical protein